MKKILLSVCCLTFLISAAFFVNGCSKGHTHDYTTTVIAPTCSSQGYTEHVCSCGETYKDNFVEPIDHTQGVPTYAATVDSADATKGVLHETESCKFCSTVLSENDYNISLPELTFSYDGEPHGSKIEGDALPDGIEVVYLYSTDLSSDDKLSDGIISAGDYAVTATLVKDGTSIDLDFCLFSKLHINKDGKYHEVTFCFDDLPTNNISIAVKDGSTIDEDKMPAIPDKTGYTGEWIYEGAEIHEDTSISILYTPIKFSIEYILDGAENNPRNPSYYTYESGTISLYAPESVTGYAFQGWYTTANFEPQSRISVISSGSSGNLTLYAKFLKYRVEAADGFTFDHKNYDYPALIQTVSSSRTSIALSTTIQVSEGCTWTLSRDIEGFELIKTKNMSLVEGHNIAYITVWYGDEYNVVYYLDVYRLGHRSYAYYADGEVYCESAIVEEQTYLSAPEAPSKIGYTFNGWYAYNLPSSSEDFNPSSPVIGTTAATFPYRLDYNVIFYAIFTPNVYTATFDVNGGKPLAYETQNVTYDTPFTPAEAERDGYTFVGWKDDEGNVFKSLLQWKYDYPVTLTAQWSLNTYEIVYELDGGTNDENNPTTCTVESPTIEFAAPTRTGYTFNGWYAKKDFSGNNVTELQQGSYGNVTLYAKWTANTYTITYLDTKLITGTKDAFVYAKGETYVQNVTYDENYDLINYERTGYAKTGWFNGDEKFDGGIWNLTNDVTLYVDWQIVTYYITYVLDGGTNDESNPTTYTVESPTIGLTAPAKTAYSFAGWFTDRDFTNEITEIGAGSFGNKTIYAKWTPVVYEIVYELDGGTNDENNPTTYTVKSPTIEFAAPTRTGYTFNGWYAQKDFSGNNVTELSQGSYGNVTLYAKWTANTYTITYLDTKLITGTKDAFVYAKGETYVQNVTYDENYDLINYERTGYAKTGWFNGDEKFDGGIWNLTNDVTLYVDWQVITYNITYVLNGGDTIGENPTEYTIESQDITLANPTGKHTFVGWYKDEALKEKITVITNHSFGDITLYADWQHETTTDWVIDKAPTCTNTGLRHNVCSVCGVNYNYETLATVPTAHVHGEEVKENVIAPTCTENGSYDVVVYCTECNIVLSSTHVIVTELLDHEWGESNRCKHCNCDYFSQDLKFTLSSSGTSYIVSGIGSCVDSDIIIPENYKGKPVISIGDSAFAYCSNLTNVTIGNGVTSIGYKAFYGCSSLTSITIPDTVTSIGGSAFAYCSLTSITIPDGVTSINSYAFYSCSGLTSVTIPDSVTSIGYDAFYHCWSLTSVTIPNGVTSINSYAFYSCSGLTSVTIPDSVISIGSFAFRDCRSLTSVIWNAEKCTKADNRSPIFDGCSKLSSVTIGENVKTIPSYAFYGCHSLTSITIPDSVTSIGDSAFAYCSGLTSIVVENNNQYFTSIDGNLYNKDKTKLIQYAIGKTDVLFIIPDSVTSIGYDAFYHCWSLTSVTIPDSVTSIGDSAFYDCSNLTSVTIPDGVTSIGNSAFYDCSSLKTVFYKGTAEQWDKISIGYNNTKLTTADRYYYSESEPALNSDGSAYDGNYWHYDTDGITPVIWKKEN